MINFLFSYYFFSIKINIRNIRQRQLLLIFNKDVYNISAIAKIVGVEDLKDNKATSIITESFSF